MFNITLVILDVNLTLFMCVIQGQVVLTTHLQFSNFFQSLCHLMGRETVHQLWNNSDPNTNNFIHHSTIEHNKKQLKKSKTMEQLKMLINTSVSGNTNTYIDTFYQLTLNSRLTIINKDESVLEAFTR